jgi:lipopolysaccharide transport system permease protein/teichoic acid transport system permease protein
MARFELVVHSAGNIAGIAWTVVKPVIQVAMYYFFFSFVLRLKFQEGQPYVLVLVAGLIPWWTFMDTLTYSAISITGNPHLVKRMVFPIEVLVPVTFMTSLVSHAAMLFVLVGLIYVFGLGLGLYSLQLPYYFLGLGTLSLGLGWLVSAFNVVYRDTGQALAVLLNLWFWVTPVAWPVAALPNKYHWVVTWNPMWYIVDGYRKALVTNEGFWTQPDAALVFWLQALSLLAMGVYGFRRLKAEFAEL